MVLRENKNWQLFWGPLTPATMRSARTASLAAAHVAADVFHAATSPS